MNVNGWKVWQLRSLGSEGCPGYVVLNRYVEVASDFVFRSETEATLYIAFISKHEVFQRRDDAAIAWSRFTEFGSCEHGKVVRPACEACEALRPELTTVQASR